MVYPEISSRALQGSSYVYGLQRRGCMGLGEDARVATHVFVRREDVDLHTYIQDIKNFLYSENLSNVTLVSHGYCCK